MKARTLFLIFLIVSLTSANAQVISMLDDYGDAGSDRSRNIILDDEGNAYMTGSFNSPTISFGSLTLVSSSGGAHSDVFVAKFDPAGTPVWAINSTGPFADAVGMDIAVDDDLIYIIGSFEFDSIYFDPSAPLINSGGSDFFVASFKKSDGSHIWSFSNDAIPGHANLNEYGEGIDVGADGKLSFIGSFNSDHLDCNAFSLTNSVPGSGNYDVFIGTLDAGAIPGYTMNWFHNPIGGGDDFGKDIALDVLGNVYVCGYFYSQQLIFDAATPGSILFNTDVSGSTSDIFTVEFSAGSFVWGENPAGADDEYALGIATNGWDVYVTGGYKSGSLDFGGSAGAITNPSTMYTDFFLANYKVSVPGAIWVQTANADITHSWNFDEYGNDLAIDPAGFVYVTGWYNSYKIDFGTGVITNETNNNYSEIIIAKYSNAGILHWVDSGHGIYNDRGMGVDVKESDGCCVITGWYESDPMDFGTYSLGLANPVESSDLYLARNCGYDCVSACEHPVDTLNTGIAGIGSNDPYWMVVADPFGGAPRPAVGCVWNAPSWSYGSPFAGSNWISVVANAVAPIGLYKFERTFTIVDSCLDPYMELCLLADDSVDVFLNGVLIGSGGDLYTPTHFSAAGWSVFTTGANVLSVELHNTIANQAAFDLKGWVCCKDIATGVEQQQMETKEELLLYPNPAGNHINLRSVYTGCKARVLEYTGKQLMEFDVSRSNYSLNISSLKPGLYFVSLIKSDGSLVSSRFIKQ